MKKSADKKAKGSSLTFTFDEPYEFEEKSYDEIVIDFGTLKGRDMSQLKREWTESGAYSPVIATDADYCAMVGCRAAGLPIEFAHEMRFDDYTRFCMQVQGFLLN